MISQNHHYDAEPLATVSRLSRNNRRQTTYEEVYFALDDFQVLLVLHQYALEGHQLARVHRLGLENEGEAACTVTLSSCPSAPCSPVVKEGWEGGGAFGYLFDNLVATPVDAVDLADALLEIVVSELFFQFVTPLVHFVGHGVQAPLETTN